jgi:hypothetical protein
LNVTCTAHLAEIGVRISEALCVEVRLPNGKSGQIGKNIKASESVQIGGAKGNVTESHSSLKKMLSALPDNAVAEIHVRLVSPAVPCIWCPEVRKTSTTTPGPSADPVRSATRRCGNFKVQLIEKLW